MAMPNFFIVGAGRTGTTSLYHYLAQHPDVFMCPVKEPQFFAYDDEPPEFSGPAGVQSLPPYSSQLASYQELYTAVSDETAIGEASVDYLYLPQAAGRIRHHTPDARIIILLRQPVDRAYSQFWSRVSQGLEPERDFETAFHLSETRAQEGWPPWFHYKQKSFYADALRRYFEFFPREQQLHLLHEDYHLDPVKTFQRIARFLHVDATFVPDTQNRHNLPRGIPKDTTGARVLRVFQPLALCKAAIRVGRHA